MHRRLLRNIAIAGCLTLALGTQVFAGNPDRQGEAGGVELLFSVWARSSGFHTQNTSFVSGVEAMRLNVAGLARINKTEIIIAHTNLFEGTGMAVNSLGMAFRTGESGTIGITISSVDFGDIPITTEDNPEGTGATFSPSFFHMGIAYAKTFENKVSVGFLVRGVSESLADISAFGFAIDAGVQYVTGPQDNFMFGISLRNVGSPMTFGGEGLSFRTNNPGSNVSYDITVNQRGATFELPSALNIGASYAFVLDDRDSRLTVLANFTANSFSKDQIGAGLEFSFRGMFMVRGAYRADMGKSLDGVGDNAYTGLAAGATIEVPVKKGGSSRFAVDYAWRASSPFGGTHNFSLLYKI